MTVKNAFDVLVNTTSTYTGRLDYDESLEHMALYDNIESQIEAVCKAIVRIGTVPILNKFLPLAKPNEGCESFYDEVSDFSYKKNLDGSAQGTISLHFHPYGNARKEEILKATVEIFQGTGSTIDIWLDGSNMLDLEAETRTSFKPDEIQQALKHITQWVAKIDSRYIEKAKLMPTAFKPSPQTP